MTEPTEQRAWTMALLALASSLPLRLGTVHALAKLALTERLALIVTVQVLLPEQPLPLQPEKIEPVAALAVSVTELPRPKAAEQVAPQLMPAGLEVTVPVPFPAFVTVSVRVCAAANVAVTERSTLIVTVHVAVPEQSPLQPVKVEPAAALAVSVTELPALNVAEHVAPQAIPGGLDDTVPAPVPAFVTDSV